MPFLDKFLPAVKTCGRKRYNNVKLFAGLFSNDPDIFQKIRKELEKQFGQVDLESRVMDFNHTDFYNEEFGMGLKKIFYSFNELRRPDNLYKVKSVTCCIEKKYLRGHRRSVNIDPGYIDMGKVVLFTTKDYSHRLYLGGNIYGEVTLKFEGGRFACWPWTYPDYRSGEYMDYFTKMRDIYKTQIKK